MRVSRGWWGYGAFAGWGSCRWCTEKHNVEREEGRGGGDKEDNVVSFLVSEFQVFYYWDKYNIFVSLFKNLLYEIVWLASILIEFVQ